MFCVYKDIFLRKEKESEVIYLRAVFLGRHMIYHVTRGPNSTTTVLIYKVK
jgi:hypothetical protein